MGDAFQDILFRKKRSNPTISCDYEDYELPFYKSNDDLSTLDEYVNFIKGVERIVRASKYYSRYVAYIKKDIGLNMCQVLSNVKEEDDQQRLLDMHHGPILTLFDYAAIITDSYLSRGKKVNSFIIAKAVIEEHFENNVQVVMISETVHQAIHDYGGPFINCKQAFGDLNKFLSKYSDGITDDAITKINKYIELSDKYDSFDKDLFKLENHVKKWSDNYDFYEGENL